VHSQSRLQPVTMLCLVDQVFC